MDKIKNLIIIKVINIIVRTFFMAVPKRRQSNAQSGMRSATWKRKALDAARNALSLGKSLTTRKSKGFYYPPAPVSDDWEAEAEGFGPTLNSAE